MVGRIVPGRKFFVVVAGTTNGTHTNFVSQMKRSNYVEVHSAQDSDFILVFCPIVSRVGTDIKEALQNVDPNKAKLLVVMHHTFNPDLALAESRRQVEDPNVLLTVDCLFYEAELLHCRRNDVAWGQFCSSLEIPSPQSSLWERLPNYALDILRPIIYRCLCKLMDMVIIVRVPPSIHVTSIER